MKLARGWLLGNFPVLTYAVPASLLVPPVAIFFALRRWMVAGLTFGNVGI